MPVRYRRDSPGRKARFTDSPDSLDWQIQVQRTFRFCAISQSGASGESGETSVTRRKENQMATKTQTIEVKVDERLAAEIAGKAVHGWHATAYSDGKKRVYVTFEEVKTVGAGA